MIVNKLFNFEIERPHYDLLANVLEIRLDFKDHSLIYYDRASRDFSYNDLSNIVGFEKIESEEYEFKFKTYEGDLFYKGKNEPVITLELNDLEKNIIYFHNNGKISFNENSVYGSAENLSYNDRIFFKTEKIYSFFYENKYNSAEKTQIFCIPPNGKIESKFRFLLPDIFNISYGGAIYDNQYLVKDRYGINKILLSTNMDKDFSTLDSVFYSEESE